MTKVKGFAQKHKRLIVVLLVLAVAASLTIFLLGSSSGSAQAAALPSTTILVKGDLAQTVTANGTVQSANAKDVSSSLTYKVTEILVDVGDTVKAGQQLVVLDTSDLEKSIADTRKSLSEAQAKDRLQLQQAERKLREAIESRDINLAKNDAAITAAANTLNNANNTLAAANAKLGAVPAAEAAVQQWQQTLDTAKAARDSWTPPLDDPLAENPYIAEVAAAEAALAAAQEALATAQKAQPTVQQEQASAATAVASAQTAYDNAVTARDTGYRNDSIAIENAQDTVNTAKLTNSGQTHQTQLDSYLKQLEESVITAPISGTVTASTAQVGSAAGAAAGAAASALFTIEDTQNLEIPAYVPEYDMVQLRVGMQVEVATDAIGGETWTASIKSISPTAADANGNFLVTVSITSPVGRLAGGMSAKLNILVEQKAEVYAVPYDAVVTDETGALVVYVLEDTAENGTGPARRAIAVVTGMETDYYIEVIADELEDGMQVVNDPENKNVPSDTGSTGGLFAR